MGVGLANFAVERAAGSHSLAAAAHRGVRPQCELDEGTTGGRLVFKAAACNERRGAACSSACYDGSVIMFAEATTS